jgi:oxygen-independent coproporphyrinogen-3 oxidase
MSVPGLYIHIPFCRRKCHYCSFYSTTALELVPDFLKAVRNEMDIYLPGLRSFDTIYIGGGTPSLLSVKDMAAILEGAAGKYTIPSCAEITLEANPADIDRPRLKAWRRMGINRLNIGVQSFDDNMLHFLGRRHNGKQAMLAIKAAQDAGFDNTGIDLIYGAPGQESACWEDTLSLALSLNPAHLSCYQLTVEPDTPLGIRQTKGEISLPDEGTMGEFFFKTAKIIEKAGYTHYEVSNFARNEHFLSQHNQKYWDHTPYLGLGPAAHSFDGRRRWWNQRDLSAYLRDMERGVPPVAALETLTDEQLRLEALFLGLRTKSGICFQDYKRRYGYDLLLEKAETISLLVEKGLLEIRNGCLRPTLAGLAVADSLALI